MVRSNTKRTELNLLIFTEAEETPYLIPCVDMSETWKRQIPTFIGTVECSATLQRLRYV